MKDILKYPALIMVSAMVLVGCQSEENSDNSAPEIKAIHTYSDAMPADTDERAESDMRLHLYVQVEDADGLDDLTHFYVKFPSGFESEVEITDDYRYSIDGVDYLNIIYLMSNFGDANTRQIPMTGYSLKLKDSSNASDVQLFKVNAPDNEFVPDGARLVHPNDYDNVGSGGDYFKALGLPTLHSASYDNGANEITVNIENSDSRATELQLFFYVNGDYVGWLQDEDETRLATLDTPFDYTVAEGDVAFTVSGVQLADVDKIIYAVYDSDITSGPFSGISFSSSRSMQVLF